MSKSDLEGLQGNYQQLGSSMYLFRSTTVSHEALISAHGGFYKSTKTFTVPPGMTIHFWAPHGYTLTDPGIKAMYTTRGMEPMETVMGGKPCIDYALSKYQGSHGGSKGKPAETYASIAKAIATEDKNLISMLKRLEHAKEDWQVEGALGQIAASGSMNVITIRNRALRGSVWLSELVTKVRKHASSINTLHCSFCRSSMTSESDPSWKIGKGHTGFS